MKDHMGGNQARLWLASILGLEEVECILYHNPHNHSYSAWCDSKNKLYLVDKDVFYDRRDAFVRAAELISEAIKKNKLEINDRLDNIETLGGHLERLVADGMLYAD